MDLLVVPQWFGSGSPDAARLVDGGGRLAARLAVEEDAILPLPEAGPDLMVDGVRRLPQVAEVADRVRERVLAARGPLLVLGGDCGVEWGAIGARERDSTAVVWLDAHPDLNTPVSSPSGSFHGMVLRRLIADGLPPANVILAGTRSVDAPERTAISEAGIVVVPVPELADGVLAELRRIDPEDVWIHVDLDVLDPVEFRSLGFPEPEGAHPDTLLTLIAAIRERWPLAGAAVTEFAPAPGSDDCDLETVVRIVDAIRS